MAYSEREMVRTRAHDLRISTSNITEVNRRYSKLHIGVNIAGLVLEEIFNNVFFSSFDRIHENFSRKCPIS